MIYGLRYNRYEGIHQNDSLLKRLIARFQIDLKQSRCSRPNLEFVACEIVGESKVDCQNVDERIFTFTRF